MFNFMNNWYTSLLTKFDFLKKANEYRIKELTTNSNIIHNRYRDYLTQLIDLENKSINELKNFNYLKKDVNNRYWSNISRFFSGGSLLQEVEEKCGLEYVFDKRPKLVVVDKNKFDVIKSDLELVLSKEEVHSDLKPYIKNDKKYTPKSNHNGQTNHKVQSNHNGQSKYDVQSNNAQSKYNATENKSIDDILNNSPKQINNSINNNGSDNISALYIDSFKDDCYTNMIAKVSSSNSGSIKDVANILASYVKSDSVELISPHKRTWKSRISNLENAILNNNFNSKDHKALHEIKQALAKNSYLVNKKSDLYKKAVNLIDSAIRRDYVEK